MSERVLSPPDRMIKSVRIKHRKGTPNYSVVAYGTGRVPIWRFRGAKSVKIEGNSVETEISGFKTTIHCEPGPALNAIEVLEAETDERKYIIVRGAYKVLGGI